MIDDQFNYTQQLLSIYSSIFNIVINIFVQTFKLRLFKTK